jgi:hypothetical protein
MKNNYSQQNRSLKKVFESLKEKYHLPFGKNKFEAIFTCLEPNAVVLRQLYALIRANLQKIWLSSGPVCIDECLYSYQQSVES